ncbi:MAG: zf-HC2 domain-containing protein [Vicinamibacterales bacterium]|nr:zf-HC2 domain-containing protein [Vicinamibacterales bacterium]
MPDACGRTFDETFLSGYLDRALVQGDEQRVRVHLKGCVSCRALLDELTSMRDATMSSTFKLPRDEEWSETPRTGASRLLRGLGWRLMSVWAVVVAGFGLWESWQDADNLFERVLLVGGVSGVSLILISVFLDRRHAMKTDRYREVRR